ncbi:MAG: GH116 family glycosyl hydrolase [Candidatus Omnitrophota bacterium]
MPKYTSRDKVRSGVPLGGIGAGKIEMMPTGAIDFITIQNNWSAPIRGASGAGVLGFHFGIFTKCEGRKRSKLLQTARVNAFPHTAKIDYEGRFPISRLKYSDKDLPLKVELTCFSSLVPGNTKDSSLPGAFFKFKVKNPSKRRVEASLLSIGRNIIGNWGIGRFNAVAIDRDQVCLTFGNNRKDTIPNDFSLGDMTISVSRAAGEVTYMGEWNMQGECFKMRETRLKLDAWDSFSKTGRLPNSNTKKAVEGESVELGGALAVHFELGPGEEKEVTFIYSWFFPVHTVGHIYEKWFRGSVDVSRYMFRQGGRLLKKTEAWQNALMESSLPGWLSDALINNLYPLFSSTWLARDGRFSTYEAPIVCPLMGTLDVRFYGSLPTGILFPDLEISAMMQFAGAQRPDGYIPHDLGRNRIDLPSDGTTYYKWKDLCSKFVLLCYKDYMRTKDKKFLKRVYPKIKKAMEWQISQDRNKDFLPDNEGQDHTFDMWNFYGTNSYTAGIFLAALLASIRIARIFSDARSVEIYRDWFKKGRESFEGKLWNSRYFVNWVCEGRGSDPSSSIAQLNGQWYAHMLGLGYIVDKAKVRKAVRSILTLHKGKASYGLVNSVFSDGRINKDSMHSENVFPGMSYAFASLCIYEGYVKEGLEIAKSVWDNAAYNLKTPWNQPDMLDRRSGKGLFGDYYMRSMVIWSIPLALAKKDKRLRNALKKIYR